MKNYLLYIILSLLTVTVYATGPGNVSSGLKMWLDASTLSLNNNDPVSSWTDLSGNGNHATQDTLTRQPQFKTNMIYSKPAVLFTANDYLAINGAIVANTNYTIFAVVKRTSSSATNSTGGSSGGHHYFLGGATSSMNNNLHIGWRGNSTFSHSQYTNEYDLQVPSYNVNDPASLYSLRHSNTAGKETYINGGLRAMNMNPASNGRLAHLQAWSGASIGRYLPTSTYFNGWVAELVIYDRYLSDIERRTVEGYIKTKYNLAIGVDANSPAHYTAIFNPILSVSSSKTTETKQSGGLTIGGTYGSVSASIYAGHNNLEGISSANNPSSVSYPNFSRLKRQWFMDFRGTLTTSFSFNLTDLGLGDVSPSGSKYALLFRPCTCQDFSIVSNSASISGKVISFSGISRTALANNGFYTLGTLDNSESTLPVELSAFLGVLTPTNTVRLEWITESETGILGYYLYRGSSNLLSGAQLISPLINSLNSSGTTHYSWTDEELYQSGTYWYWLQILNLDGSHEFQGPITVRFNPGENPYPGIPLKTGITSTYPNPFNPSIRIAYAVKEQTDVQLLVYNIKGQLLKEFSLPNAKAGTGVFLWDAAEQASGIYLLKFNAGKTSEMRKITLSK